ncbi:substrate-binding and VWA domain-containing protein [Streptomonospora litoralis]|uniref:von Willebrand factor type A domain protein n=1 Tax=Streptomonospora litoralis TaxID=2498135 RepID=A0A4P6PY79_9ACTN|nr:von Willebrand factor type A domain protein [Streptomonospora litoralis]
MGRHRGNNDDGADRWDRADRHDRRASGRSRRRRRRGRGFTALAAAFAIIIGLGVTGWYVLDTSGGCGGQDVELGIAASPEITPALKEIAADFNADNDGVDGRCVQAEVRAAESANITYGITGSGPASGETESDVWIPDSSLWSNLVKDDSGDSAFTDTGTSVASSPLVLARPAEAESSGDQPSWEALVPTAAPSSGSEGSQVQLVDPIRSSSGMATLALVAGAIGQEDEQGRPQLVAALQALQRNVAADQEAAFTTLAENPESSGVLVLSEQAAWRYNQDHGDAPAQIGYPQGGTYRLDYPYIDRSTDPVVSQAAELFREELTRKAAQRVLLKDGFRTPAGKADPQVLAADAGFKESAPEDLPTPSTQDVQRLTQAWNRLKLDSRLLTIADVSGSMLEPVPGTGMNRMQITAAAAIQGLDLFPEGSELGMWRFSVGINDGLDYEEMMPIRELSAEVEGGVTQKEALVSQWNSLQPVPDGDTGLYDTYLAAYRQMSRTYKADRVNAILMLTDGNNDDSESISLDKLLSTIEEESSPVRPIPVFTIAFGPDIDPEPLQKIAEATGGASYTTEDPTEIGDIFLQAFSHRLEPAAQGG